MDPEPSSEQYDLGEGPGNWFTGVRMSVDNTRARPVIFQPKETYEQVQQEDDRQFRLLFGLEQPRDLSFDTQRDFRDGLWHWGGSGPDAGLEHGQAQGLVQGLAHGLAHGQGQGHGHGLGYGDGLGFWDGLGYGSEGGFGVEPAVEQQQLFSQLVSEVVRARPPRPPPLKRDNTEQERLPPAQTEQQRKYEVMCVEAWHALPHHAYEFLYDNQDEDFTDLDFADYPPTVRGRVLYPPPLPLDLVAGLQPGGGAGAGGPQPYLSSSSSSSSSHRSSPASFKPELPFQFGSGAGGGEREDSSK